LILFSCCLCRTHHRANTNENKTKANSFLLPFFIGFHSIKQVNFIPSIKKKKQIKDISFLWLVLLFSSLSGAMAGRPAYNPPKEQTTQPKSFHSPFSSLTLLNGLSALVFFLGRSHWLASQPITHPMNKRANPFKRREPPQTHQQLKNFIFDLLKSCGGAAKLFNFNSFSICFPILKKKQME